jgi:hypothetical protein
MTVSSLSRGDVSPALKHRRIIRSPRLSRKPLQESPISSQNTSHTDTKQTEKPNLAPCHICWRGPRLKKDLDSYTDCRRCKKRTCYICIRQCEVIDCRSGKICGSCCVEIGVDGDVFCHDCLSNSDDHAMEQWDKVLTIQIWQKRSATEDIIHGFHNVSNSTTTLEIHICSQNIPIS